MGCKQGKVFLRELQAEAAFGPEGLGTIEGIPEILQAVPICLLLVLRQADACIDCDEARITPGTFSETTELSLDQLFYAFRRPALTKAVRLSRARSLAAPISILLEEPTVINVPPCST